MTDRMFRLLELHQKLDAVLRRARAARADPATIARLNRRKLRLRERLARSFAAARLAV